MVKRVLATPGRAEADASGDSPAVTRLEVAAYTVPTDRPRRTAPSAGTRTTLVTVHAHAGGAVGLGYTYADASRPRT